MSVIRNQINSKKDVNLLRIMDSSKRVLVVGPTILNETIFGKCNRLAADFPIPVFEKISRTYELGGPGNVVRNLQALGIGVDLLTMIGDRDQYVIDTIRSYGIDSSGAVTCPEYSVAKKIRFVSDGGYVMFRVNEGDESFTIDKHVEEKIVSVFKEKIDYVGYHVIILSDYRFGMLSNHVTSCVISMAASKGIPIIVDPPKFGNFDKFKGCTYFKPNLDEAKYFLSSNIDSSHEAIRSACVEIGRRLETPYSIITLAERGVAFYDKGMDHFDVVPAPNIIDVVDVSGAGDTALAAMAFGIAHDISLEESCRLANRCAANVIQKPGGSVVVDLIDIIKEQERVFTDTKEVKNLGRLLAGKGNLVLVLLDLFDHVTNVHLGLLKKARALGGHVIVAVAPSTGSTSPNVDRTLEFVKEALKCNRNIDFLYVPGKSFDRESIIRIVRPDYLADMALGDGEVHPYENV